MLLKCNLSKKTDPQKSFTFRGSQSQRFPLGNPNELPRAKSYSAVSHTVYREKRYYRDVLCAHIDSGFLSFLLPITDQKGVSVHSEERQNSSKRNLCVPHVPTAKGHKTQGCRMPLPAARTKVPLSSTHSQHSWETLAQLQRTPQHPSPFLHTHTRHSLSRRTHTLEKNRRR